MFSDTRATTVVSQGVEVLDRVGVRPVQAQPGLLHRVVGLAQRAQHPVRHGPEPRCGAPRIALPASRARSSVTFLRRRGSYPIDTRIRGRCEPKGGERDASLRCRSERCDRHPARPSAASRPGHEVVGTVHSSGKRRARASPWRRAGRARPARRGAGCAEAVLEAAARRDRARGDRAGGRDLGPQLRPRLRRDQRTAHRRAPTRCWPPRARPACGGSSRRASPSYRYARDGGPVKTEDDPLDSDPPRGNARRAGPRWSHLEQAVVGRRWDRAALRRLLRGGQRRPDRAGAEAAVPDHR